MKATLNRMVRDPRTGEVHLPHEPLSIWRTRPRSCPLSHSQRHRFELGVAEGAQSIEPD
jgi:hypothetical protein